MHHDRHPISIGGGKQAAQPLDVIPAIEASAHVFVYAHGKRDPRFRPIFTAQLLFRTWRRDCLSTAGKIAVRGFAVDAWAG